MSCPNCGSTNIGGLMPAFWVALNADGEPVNNWHDWGSETELGPQRCCFQCNHEWDEGEEETEATP